MNQPFMFAPPLNPYADNEKFVKKTFSRRRVMPVIVSLGVVLTMLVYAVIRIINYSETVTPYVSDQSEEVIMKLASTGVVLSYVI